MKLSDQKVKEFQLLRMALREGIIDMDRLSSAVRMKRAKEYLERHNKSIWQGKNEYWYTKLDGRLIKKKRLEDLQDLLISRYEALDPDRSLTFKSVYNEWIESKASYNEVKQNSILRYRDDYKRFFEGKAFESTPIDEIDDVVLDEFVRNTISTYELTAKSYACFRTIVLGVMKYAKRYHYTSFSVSMFFKDFQISKSAFKAASKKKTYIYSKEERSILYEYFMKNPSVVNLGLAFMCLTGLRVGELSALKKEDNIELRKLYVHRTETRAEIDGKKQVIVQDTAKMGHDDIVILPRAAQRIIDITNMRTHDCEYLFSENGKRITAHSYRRWLEKACKEVGIDYRPPHQMRKTYASILLSSGIDEAIVKKEMRHTDISTTRQYYQYVTESDLEEQDLIERTVGL